MSDDSEKLVVTAGDCSGWNMGFSAVTTKVFSCRSNNLNSPHSPNLPLNSGSSRRTKIIIFAQNDKTDENWQQRDNSL